MDKQVVLPPSRYLGDISNLREAPQSHIEAAHALLMGLKKLVSLPNEERSQAHSLFMAGVILILTSDEEEADFNINYYANLLDKAHRAWLSEIGSDCEKSQSRR